MSFPQRLPSVNSDDGQWGDILNQYISLQHYNNAGVNDPLNGTHKTVTLQPGTTASLTAPLKFAAGPLMTTPEAGAVEFYGDNLFFTQATGPYRKVLITTDYAGGVGDTLYLNSSQQAVRLPIGASGQVLTVVSGFPLWQPLSATIANMDGGNASAVYGGSYQINGGGA